MLRNSHRPDHQWHPLIFYIVAAIIVVADQLTKTLIRIFLEPGQSIPEKGFIRITYVQNAGAAFGILQGYSVLFTILHIIGIIIIVSYALYFNKRFPLLNDRLGSVVLGLILGGTAGNLIDRLRLGYVTDFIDIGIWPSFNVADSALTIGIIIFAFILLMLAREEKN